MRGGAIISQSPPKLYSPLQIHPFTCTNISSSQLSLSTHATPPPTNYDLVPLSRRAAVLVLLYTDAKGDLRVVAYNASADMQAKQPSQAKKPPSKPPAAKPTRKSASPTSTTTSLVPSPSSTSARAPCFPGPHGTRRAAVRGVSAYPRRSHRAERGPGSVVGSGARCTRGGCGVHGTVSGFLAGR
ncbi:hypothetical protein ARAM_004628 [Aspergillus rambellii]|uniref:Uncharacterized protein n=1 Tax=Aspergillus rambellii TaxID=308745 RepID=A0A0F8V0P4_9EURO|nr:hypothetical protein ARAM_004628 [Aspergillus rambellii]